MNITLRLWFIICVLIALATAAGAATLNAKVTQVESGNTVIVSNINRPLRVRLKAIAPPEGSQPFSEAAREHLKALIFNKAVAVEYTNMSDGYLDARIYLDGIDIGSQMLRDGVAWYDRNTDYALTDADRDFYLRCEQAARNEKRGLWSDAAPVAPWDYRKVQVARIESIPRATAAPARALNTRTDPPTSFSNSDLLGAIFGGSSSAGAPQVHPIAPNGTPDRWMKFESAAEHFSISVPSNSVEGSLGGGKGNPMSFHFVAGGSAQGFCVFVSISEPPIPATDSAVADQAMQGLIAGMNEGAKRDGEYDRLIEIQSSRDIKVDGLSGRQYVLHSEAFSGSARVFTRKVGAAQQLFVAFTLIKPGSETWSARFINSLKIQ